MLVLVINSGSSSLKFKLFDLSKAPLTLASGSVERIGEETAALKISAFAEGDKRTIKREDPVADHEEALSTVVGLLTDPEVGVIKSVETIAAVGHRVVHGGESFTAPAVVDDAVLAAIEAAAPLAPLHNPANAMGIAVASRLMPKATQVAVFDTAFHQTMPPEAYMYALPHEFYTELGVRRYGFHGTSHKYVTQTTAELMGIPYEQFTCISAHLGNGASMAAVKEGRCVDTTLGMTPLAGLIMGTRTGDFDPAVLFYLTRMRNYSMDELDRIVNKESGLKGICGHNDLRDIHARAEDGDERASLALEMLCYRNRKYIGAYFAILGNLDAIIFTAGIGENDRWVREHSLAQLEHLGIMLDTSLNEGRFSEPTRISTVDSRVAVWVTPTDEELEIARQTRQAL